MGKALVSKSWQESKLLWHIAFPAILTAVFQFSIGFVTVGFVGHIGSVELAAVTVVENVIEGFAYGVLLGMGSALETLCGQAVGAGQVDMLGVYIQRSWIICGATALVLTPTYLFTGPILRALRQPGDIADVAGTYCRWVVPQLFAYAANFPLQKFFQSQSRVWVVTFISGAGLAVHVALNYVFVTRLGHGLLGAALVGNFTWWLIIVSQMGYLVSGCFPEAWRGFSMLAFKNLAAFVKLSLASAVMLCLELWYYTAVLILVGFLKNAQLQIDVMSICINYQLWTLMVALGFNAAVSVRVSNELGANRPKAAKFSVIMAVLTSGSIGAVFFAVFLGWRTGLPRFFSEDEEVLREASKLGYLLAGSIFLNSIQPVLSGVAIGAGWQALVAFVNIGSYYFVGIPLAALFGFKLNMDAMGIWVGMTLGTLLQTAILIFISYRTKWDKQAMRAEERVREWGGRDDALPSATQVAPAIEDADRSSNGSQNLELQSQHRAG
ncbi:Protein DETOXIFICATION 29 [Dichanthelium oligosanthes]|uniref:Protein DETOXIFICATION n=1 Tax=Dichanthelium oligosanthes TaxID=888268 RepID=A0A1E5VWA9_9POAL|nr:Protein DETOXIFICATION 29 [Dichanthelium oligosanthes]